MEKKNCTICKKRFTRQWNLDRHLKDIHNISDYGENDIAKQKYDRFYLFNLYTQLRTSILGIPEHNMNEMNHYPNPPQYHNFTRDYASEYVIISGFIKIMNYFLERKRNRS